MNCKSDSDSGLTTTGILHIQQAVINSQFSKNLGKPERNLLKRILRRIWPNPKVVPHTGGFLRLYPWGVEYWVIEGMADQELSPSVRLCWKNHVLGQTLWQKLKPGEPSVGFRFKFHQSLLSALFHGGRLTIETGSMTWNVQPSRIYLKNGDCSPTLPEEDPENLLTNGYILGSAGRLQKPKNLDTQWIEQTLSHYDRARNLFKDLFGYELFVVGGTLLGWVRNRDIISFDKDFDTGYLSDLTAPEEIQAEFAQIVKTLLERGEKIQLVGTDRNHRKFLRRNYFFWLLDGEHHIDVFPGALIEGRFRRPTFVQTELVREDLLPLRKEQLRGHDILVPQNFEKKLAAVYGPNWRIPDPFWKKVMAPTMPQYLRQIQLSERDLLEIAERSPLEKESIQFLVDQNNNHST
jgi:hypothetical protein